jgi:serine/threonine protein kinase
LFLHNHRPPILHRAFKPSNVLLTAGLMAKVADVKLAPGPQDAHTDAESLRTGEFSAASDVFSFGVTLLQALTGRT